MSPARFIIGLLPLLLLACGDGENTSTAPTDPAAIWTSEEWYPVGLVGAGSELFFSYAEGGELWMFDEVRVESKLLATPGAGVEVAVHEGDVYYVGRTRYRHSLASLCRVPRDFGASGEVSVLASAPFQSGPHLLTESHAYLEVAGAEQRALMAVALDGGEMRSVRELRFREDADSPFGGVTEYLDAVFEVGEDLILVGNFLEDQGNPPAMLRLTPGGEETRVALPRGSSTGTASLVPGGILLRSADDGGIVRVDWAGEVTFVAEAMGYWGLFTAGRLYELSGDTDQVFELDVASGERRTFDTPGIVPTWGSLAVTSDHLYWVFEQLEPERYGIRRLSLAAE